LYTFVSALARKAVEAANRAPTRLGRDSSRERSAGNLRFSATEGPPKAGAYMEINHNQLLLSQESVALNASGWFNLHWPTQYWRDHKMPAWLVCRWNRVF
jgi:hypothetical protein